MTTQTFIFPIRQSLRESWLIFKAHLQFFLGMGLVSVLLGLASNNRHIPAVLSIVLGVGSYIWTIIWLKASLAAARGHYDKLNLSTIQSFLPSFNEALSLFGVGILGALAVLGGFILLVIPGIYVAVRLAFSNLSYLDRKEGIRAALRHSWGITKGDRFWTVLLVVLVAIGCYIVGGLFFGVGLLVTYPIGMLIMAKLYIALNASAHAVQEIIPQPVELQTPEQK